MSVNLKLKDSVQFFPIDNKLYHVYDASTSRHFKMGEQEVGWLKLLDGNTQVDSLRGKIPLEYFDDFISQVKRLNLLAGAENRKAFSPLKIKLLNFDPTKIIDSTRNFPLYFRLFMQWVSIPIFILNMLAITLLIPQVQNVLQGFEFTAWTVVFYLMAILVSGLVHEGSHALVARSYGVRVPKVGVMLFFLHPSFYADVSGINLLSRRNQRISVLLAGVLGNNLLMFIGILFTFAPMNETAMQYLSLFIVLNFVLIFINLIPFVEYDGYYVFQELLGEPRFAKNALVNRFQSQSRKIEYTLYFHISHIFQFVLVASMLILIRRLVLQAWDSYWVDGISLFLIIAAYPGLMAFRLKAVR